MNLETESRKATQLLKDKIVASISRHGKDEVLIKFTDGTKLFLNKVESGLELSIT